MSPSTPSLPAPAAPKPAVRSILVLCEGNHCRSPVAEGLLRARLGEGIEVVSAGLGAQTGHPPHPEAIAFLAERGLDISSLRSRSVTRDMLLSADLVLVMDDAQKDLCENLAPAARGRVFLLGAWLPTDAQRIEDPLYHDRNFFRAVFDQVAAAVETWPNHLYLS